MFHYYFVLSQSLVSLFIILDLLKFLSWMFWAIQSDLLAINILTFMNQTRSFFSFAYEQHTTEEKKYIETRTPSPASAFMFIFEKVWDFPINKRLLFEYTCYSNVPIGRPNDTTPHCRNFSCSVMFTNITTDSAKQKTKNEQEK